MADKFNHYGGELYRLQILGDKAQDLTGKRYGRLVVREFHHRTIRGRVFWICKCDCGNEVIVDAFALIYNKTLSCKCLAKEQNSKRSKEVFGEYCKKRRDRDRKDVLLKPLFNRYKSGARKRNLTFNLLIDKFKSLVFANCYYCGDAPKIEFTVKQYSGSIFYNGIDRVDNTRGYEIDNCVPCCEICNRAKLKMSEDDFLSWIKKVYINQFESHHGE